MKEERYPSLHFYTWGTVIFVLLVYKFYALINASSAANFSDPVLNFIKKLKMV